MAKMEKKNCSWKKRGKEEEMYSEQETWNFCKTVTCWCATETGTEEGDTSNTVFSPL